MTGSPLQVSVVGAGLAGLTFAAAARARGIDVQVRDERPALGGGAALTLWPNALAALDQVGLGDAVRSIGAPVGGGVIRQADGALVRRIDPVAMVRALGEPLRAVDRGELQAVLLDAATGGEPSAVLLDAGVTDPRDVPGDLVVGADGYRSVVARHLDPAITERPAGYVAWRGVADLQVDPSLAGVVWGQRAEAGVVPMTGGRTYWFVTRAGEAEVWRPDTSLWPDPLPALIAATPASSVLQHTMLERDRPRRWHDGRHVVVGDAAHAMQPGLGQGGCTAIEDAIVLADLVADAVEAGRPLAAALSAYARRRRRRVVPMARAADTSGRLLHGPWSPWLQPAARRVPEPLLLASLARVASRDAGLRAVRRTAARRRGGMGRSAIT